MNEETARQRRSADIGKLAEALAAAQKEIKAPKKGKTGKVSGEGKKGAYEYEYKYADLADVIDCYRDALSNHGLAVTQTLDFDAALLLVTTLMHSSGQWIESVYPIQAGQRPQETGSALTYARRYSVSGILGIAAEDDDDGQRAQHSEPARSEPANADASAILDLAAEIEQRRGSSIPEIIKGASGFTNDKGKAVFFDDPTKVRSLKWLASTRKKLEGELSKLDSAAEPGAKETAELFQ